MKNNKLIADKQRVNKLLKPVNLRLIKDEVLYYKNNKQTM